MAHKKEIELQRRIQTDKRKRERERERERERMVKMCLRVIRFAANIFSTFHTRSVEVIIASSATC